MSNDTQTNGGAINESDVNFEQRFINKLDPEVQRALKNMSNEERVEMILSLHEVIISKINKFRKQIDAMEVLYSLYLPGEEDSENPLANRITVSKASIE